MASVFLSYDREDGDRARPIALALEKAGHSVFWDLHIRGGAQFGKVIEEALKAADAVVVLWSKQSVESAWVKDEAAAGRDSGRLVPVTIDGIEAPLGFRQFQTIDLSRWKGRGKIPRLAELLEAVESHATQSASGPAQPTELVSKALRPRVTAKYWLVASAVLIVLALGSWLWLGRPGLPVVEVAAANGSPRSQAAASDLFVKLGSLAQVGEGKWKLVDAASAPAKPDLVFRTADTGSASQPQANLVLLDGKDDSLLWSREFSFPAGQEADLRQQLSLIAGRVLGCALESRAAGGLRRDLLKLFLNACAILAEISVEEPNRVAGPLRTIVRVKPNFTPAWRRLILADLGLIGITEVGGEEPEAVRQLRQDMADARKIAPHLPELAIADASLLPQNAYAKRLELFANAIENSPDNAALFADQSFALQQVGRMSDAVQSSRRGAELDPLSPTTTTQYIMTLAYSGQIEGARKELARAQRLWAGTGKLRDAEWAFYLRFGDPAVAKSIAQDSNPVVDSYLAARADDSPANVAKLLENIRRFRSTAGGSQYDGWLLQTLAEFAPADEIFELIRSAPADAVARDSYVLFRPALARLRRDARFIGVAKRIGLLDYWRRSNKWPDFCSEPDLPYDCKAEAAKYG